MIWVIILVLVPSGIERTNFFPTIEVGAVVACKRDENPMKNAKKQELKSKYFMRKHKQFSYLFNKKEANRMIKLYSNLPIEDFSRTLRAKCFDHKLLNQLPPSLVFGAVYNQFRTG